MSTSIAYSEALSRRVRVGDWWDQRRSTWDKIAEAIERGDPDDATALANYFGGTWEALQLPAPDTVTPVALGTFAPPDGMSPAVVECSCRLAAAVASAAEAASLDAVAVRCPSDSVGSHPGFGVMACLGVSLLSSRGIPATCTGDMVTAVAMFLAMRLGGTART